MKIDGSKLEFEIKQAGMTQAALAEDICSKSLVSKIVNGKSDGTGKAGLIEAFAKRLGVTVQCLRRTDDRCPPIENKEPAAHDAGQLIKGELAALVDTFHPDYKAMFFATKEEVERSTPIALPGNKKHPHDVSASASVGLVSVVSATGNQIPSVEKSLTDNLSQESLVDKPDGIVLPDNEEHRSWRLHPSFHAMSPEHQSIAAGAIASVTLPLDGMAAVGEFEGLEMRDSIQLLHGIDQEKKDQFIAMFYAPKEEERPHWSKFNSTGDRIKYLREMLKLTPFELARVLKVHVAKVVGWELNHYKPNGNVLDRLLMYSGTSYAWLMGHERNRYLSLTESLLSLNDPEEVEGRRHILDWLELYDLEKRGIIAERDRDKAAIRKRIAAREKHGFDVELLVVLHKEGLAEIYREEYDGQLEGFTRPRQVTQLEKVIEYLEHEDAAEVVQLSPRQDLYLPAPAYEGARVS